MTVLIEIEKKDGTRTAVYFNDETQALRVLQFIRGDAKVRTATMRLLNSVQEASSAEEAIELATGIRVPAGTFTFDASEPEAVFCPCPNCCEADPDKLIWQDDDETIRCTSCGHEFKPEGGC